MRLSWLAPLVVAFLLLGAPAGADLITFNATSYGLGEIDGVTLHRLTGTAGMTTYTPTVSAVVPSGAWWGPELVTFGTYSDLGAGYDACYNNGVPYTQPRPFSCGSFFSLLEVSFDAPTNYVQIVGDWGSDAPGMRAYRSDGSLVSECNWANTAECTSEHVLLPGPGSISRSTLTLSLAQSDITRVVYGGLFGTTTAHRITYNVPEPSTLALMTLGVIVFVRRRQRHL